MWEFKKKFYWKAFSVFCFISIWKEWHKKSDSYCLERFFFLFVSYCVDDGTNAVFIPEKLCIHFENEIQVKEHFSFL